MKRGSLLAYDIANNRLRSVVANYLIKNGWFRVQRSVYFILHHHGIKSTTRRDINRLLQQEKEAKILIVNVPQKEWKNFIRKHDDPLLFALINQEKFVYLS